MSPAIRILVLAAAMLWRLASASAGELVIRDVSVVDIDRNTILPGRTVVIRDGRIARVLEGNPVAQLAPAGALVVNGSGKFLIPGLVEGHAHLNTEKMYRDLQRRAAMPTRAVDLGPPGTFDQYLLWQFLRFGITCVFNYGSGSPDDGGLLALRDAIAAGKLLGPRLVVGRRIDGSRGVLLGEIPASRVPSSIDGPQTPEHARQAVLRARTAGYDFIKAYQHLDAATYRALLSGAREVGLRVSGHLPELDCARCEDRESAFETPLDAIAHLEELSRYALQTDLSADDLDYLTGLVRRSGASVVTTLTANRNIVHMYAYRNLPPMNPADVRLVDSLTLGSWHGASNHYLQQRFRDQPGAERFPAAYDYQRALARHLWKAGVPLIVGTDAPIPGVGYGSAVIEEMIELNKIGLRPDEVLRAASRNAFHFLGERGQAGLIEVGARADLVLLTANPLEYIGNVRAISGVVLAGQWLPIERLRAQSEAAVHYYLSLDQRLGIDSDRRRE